METLLKTEWLKIKNYNAFKVLSGFFVLGIILANYITYLANENFIKKVTPTALTQTFNPYSFENTWQTTSYVTGFLLLLPALLLIILVTNEYTYRTSRQNIIDGWSRENFIDVKLVMGLIFAIISTILVILTATTFGLLSGTDWSLNKFSHTGYFFLKAFSYNMIAILISVLIKRTGFAIALFFIYMGAENIISQILDFWSLKLKAEGRGDFGSLGDYLPMNSSDGLLTFPENPLKSMAKNAMPTDFYWVVLTLALIYLALFIWGSRRKFTTADL